MRNLFILIGLLLIAHLTLSALAPSAADHPAEAGSGPVVGVVFDVGGRGDKSFNDGAYRGAARAA